MDPQAAVDLAREALVIATLIAAPVLVAGMVVGLVIGLLQALTQIQEQTVAFVPKLLAMVVALGLSLPWVLTRLIEYSRESDHEHPRLDVTPRDASRRRRSRHGPTRILSRQPVHDLHAGARAHQRHDRDRADLRHAGVAAASAGAARRGDGAVGDAGLSRCHAAAGRRTSATYGHLMANEVAIGLLLGLGVTILFSGIQVAGQIVSQMSGMSLAEVFDPGFDENVSVFTHLFYFLTMAVFVAIGGHRIMIEAVLDTFAWAPPGHAALGEPTSTRSPA